MSDANAERYLDLMIKVLTRYRLDPPVRPIARAGRVGQVVSRVNRLLTRRNIVMMKVESSDLARREIGHDWPWLAESMVGLRRLENVRDCARVVIGEGVPGDFIETAAWRGGTCIFMRACLDAYGDADRSVWVADSFEGLPPPSPEYPADEGDLLFTREELAVSVEEVKANFERYGLLDDRVRFIQGFFSESLPTAPVEQLAVLRLDGDMYGSTMDALVNLYPKLSPGGFVIVDDYGDIPACAKAVHDYRDANGLTEDIVEIDWTGAYWRRSA
jgi:O-methyltransferase